jgi:hypothetical protein
MALRAPALVFLSVLVTTFGCGGSGDSGITAPATPFDLPIATSSGGPVLAAPRVQPIYLPGFALGSQMDAFLTNLGTSSYWPAVVTEYGVGALAVLPGHPSSVAAGANIADTGMADLMAQILTADAAALGAPRGDTIYALFFPAATTITGDGAVLCGEGGASGFHAEWTVNGTKVAGVVIPSCAHFGNTPDLTGVSSLTPVISHELVEAATDPFPTSMPAFQNVDTDHSIWSVAVSGGEIADLCENEGPSLTTPADIGLPVQRIWSNAAVMAGTGPCVPVPPGEIYFVAVPTLPDRITAQRADGRRFTVPGLVARLGSDAAVDVNLRAEAGFTDTWSVGVLELHADSAATPATTKMSGGQGQTLRLAVTPNEVSAGVFPLVVGSVRGTEFHFWFGAVQRK